MSGKVVSVNTVLEDIDRLDPDDQQYVKEIIHRRLIDAQRVSISRRAKLAKAGFHKNKCRSGTANDLLADLNE